MNSEQITKRLKHWKRRHAELMSVYNAMSHTLTETGKVLTETNFDALCDLLPSKTNWGDTLTPGIVEQIALAEREACAKGCEQLSHIGSENQLWMRDRCAAFIRSRSNVELTSGPHGATKE